MFNPANIEALLSSGNSEEAMNQLNAYLAGEGSGDDVAWFMRGKLNWQLGNRRQAITDYRTAVSINPASPAASALDQADDIMAFFNPDIFNP